MQGRVLSGIWAGVLVLSLLPTIALAADEAVQNTSATVSVEVQQGEEAKVFSTLDKAAADAADRLVTRTCENGEETLALLYPSGDGFSYCEATNEYKTQMERQRGFYFSWEIKPVAVIHTHVFYDLNHPNDVFSTYENASNPQCSDAAFVMRQQIPLYLATPTGVLKVLEPEGDSYKERMVSSETLADPKYEVYMQIRGTPEWAALVVQYPELSPMERLQKKMEQLAQ